MPPAVGFAAIRKCSVSMIPPEPRIIVPIPQNIFPDDDIFSIDRIQVKFLDDPFCHGIRLDSDQSMMLNFVKAIISEGQDFDVADMAAFGEQSALERWRYKGRDFIFIGIRRNSS